MEKKIAVADDVMCDADGPLAEVRDAEVYVGYDQQAEISCVVRANPPPEMTWWHNETLVNVFDSMKIASQYAAYLVTNRVFVILWLTFVGLLVICKFVGFG